MTPESSRKENRQRIRLPSWAVALLIAVALAFLILSSIWLFNAVQGLVNGLGVTDTEHPPAAGQDEQSILAVNSGSGEPVVELQPLISAEAFQPWSGHDRVSILILGIDQRCDETGPTRTDTMMVFTLDPVGLTAAILSLPRDLWVEIPGNGVDKINQAHFLGEAYDYPGGGPTLAVETVEAALGVEIDYYATVNFDAFVEIVDEFGGIDIVIPESIDDDSYPDNCYGYDPFNITAGERHLDGQTALKYARTRATFGGDVDRAARQQLVVMAVRDRILRLDMVPQLIRRAAELWGIVQRNVRTNLTLNEIIQLGLLVQKIPSEDIRNEVLNYDYVYNEITSEGYAVLIPVREKIRTLRDELFAPPAIPTPVIEHLPQLMAEEEARVAIYNGIYFFGLAAETQDYLAGFNVDVVEVGNADSADYRTSQIIDYGSNPATARYLTQLLNVPPLNISSSNTAAGDFDVLVIIGNDWAIPEAG